MSWLDPSVSRGRNRVQDRAEGGGAAGSKARCRLLGFLFGVDGSPRTLSRLLSGGLSVSSRQPSLQRAWGVQRTDTQSLLISVLVGDSGKIFTEETC